MSHPSRCNPMFSKSALSLAIALAFPLHAGAAEEFDSGMRNADVIKGQPPRERVEQIDTHTGNLLVRHVDLSWKGNGGMDLVVHRNYDLRGASAGLVRAYSSSYRWAPLGPGWTMLVAPRWVEHQPQHSDNTPIVSDLTRLCNGTISPGNTVPDIGAAIELPDGSKEALVFVAPGRAISRGNWKATCSANRVTVNAPDGTTYDMGDISTAWRGQDGPPPMFQLTYVLNALKATDPRGNWLSFEYRRVGAVSPLSGYAPTRISASDGRQVDLTYDETTRRLLTMQDNVGRSWTYTQSNTGDLPTTVLASVTLPGQQTWSYTYAPGVMTGPDEASNATSTKLQTLTYPEGGVVSFEVEPFIHEWHLPGALEPIKVKGERIRRRSISSGESWSYQYVHGGVGQYDTTVETGPGGVFTYKYMGAGHTVSPDHGIYVDNAWRLGQLMEKSDGQGNSETYTWAPREILNTTMRVFGPELVWDSKIWAADLTQRTIVRDGATYTTRYSNYDTYGNVGTIVETGPSGESRTTTNTYYIDTAKWIVNQFKDETRPGSTTTRSFDAYGDLVSINYNGVVTSHTYDAQGNIASTAFPRNLVHTFTNYKRGIAQSESQPEGITITRVVSDAGNITSETNGEGRTATYTHDAAGRVTVIGHPVGTSTTVSYGPNSKVITRGALTESSQYDEFGRVASVTLGGITHTYRYDALGRKVFASDADSSNGAGYEYDTINRMVRLTHSDGTSERTVYSGPNRTVYDERNNPTTYNYRSYGEPAEQHLMAITAPESAASVSIARDTRNLITSVTQGGVTRSYTYDASHRLTGVSSPETGTTTYGRDAAGNMTTRSVGSSGTTTYTYDGQNRLAGVVYPGTTPAVTKTYSKTHKIKAVSSSAASHTYVYDGNDNLTSETVTVDGIGFTTGYGYNGNDQLSSITYPISGRVVNYAPDVLGRPTVVGAYVSSIAYWPSGMVRQIAYGNGTVSSYAQHTRLWPASFTTQKGATAYMSSAYTYDGAGNLTSIADAVDSSNSRAMGFDKINRLTSISGPWGAGSITYSGNGNVTSQVLGAHSLYYNYNSGNRLDSVSGARVTSYTYDAYGNIASGSGSTYTYDGVPNLRCVNCSNSSLKIEYTYDGLNQRVAVAKGGAKTYEIYGSHGNQLLAYTPGASAKLVEYIYLGGKRIAQRVGP